MIDMIKTTFVAVADPVVLFNKASLAVCLEEA